MQEEQHSKQRARESPHGPGNPESTDSSDQPSAVRVPRATLDISTVKRCNYSMGRVPIAQLVRFRGMQAYCLQTRRNNHETSICIGCLERAFARLTIDSANMDGKPRYDR
jgi:hypothetical protein